ncbi:hypothetical protein [Streptomyces sp. NBC_01262]|uniref:hypothetical protein n=1 Tax=Streptomyces sp. NBC_01262 TaxID=2903803 RepID=UPI002E3000BE|nr:hypothetical protein [Streptomyces sp. NBC_01262]
MLWIQVALALLSQSLEQAYGPLMAVGLFVVAVGWKAQSPKAFCAGGLLVLIAIRSAWPR